MSDRVLISGSVTWGRRLLLEKQLEEYMCQGKKVLVVDKNIRSTPSSLFPDGWWSVIRFQEENMIETDELLKLYLDLKKSE